MLAGFRKQESCVGPEPASRLFEYGTSTQHMVRGEVSTGVVTFRALLTVGAFCFFGDPSPLIFTCLICFLKAFRSVSISLKHPRIQPIKAHSGLSGDKREEKVGRCVYSFLRCVFSHPDSHQKGLVPTFPAVCRRI